MRRCGRSAFPADGIGLNPAENRGVVDLDAAIQQHQLEITVADREHPIPSDRPQDDLRGEVTAFEGLILRYRDRLVGVSSSNGSNPPGSAAQSCNRTATPARWRAGPVDEARIHRGPARSGRDVIQGRGNRSPSSGK